MGKEENHLITIRELFEKSGVELNVNHFISKPGPCENTKLSIPTPTIPHHLMDPEKAEKAEILLKKCTDIVGLFGNSISKKDTDEFINASDSFMEITGVDAWDVISETRSRFINVLYIS